MSNSAHPSAHAWQGVVNLVDDYLQAAKDDLVLVVLRSEFHPSAAWIATCLDARQVPNRFVTADAGQQPSTLELAKRTCGHVHALVLEDESLSSLPLIESLSAVVPEERLSVVHCISNRPELFELALQPTPGELEGRNSTLLRALVHTETARITTRKGTDLRIRFDPEQYRWISNAGKRVPGSRTLLPAGEIATYPLEVNGVLVADVGINLNSHLSTDLRLVHRPVSLQIENSRVVRFTCECSEIRELISEQLDFPHGDRIGELGLGTNFGVSAPVQGNSHINERTCGVHLGLGQHNQGKRVEYYCPRHMDLIAGGGTLQVEGHRGADIELASVAPSAPFQFDFDTEDVFGAEEDRRFDADCCGLQAR